MAVRILLIRHGPSALAWPSGLLDRAGVERWRADYDAADIAAEAVPPAELLAQLCSCDVMAASDLPRAVGSASRLCAGRAIQVSPLLREVPLPIPKLGIRAPLAVWAALIHARWTLDTMRRRDVAADIRERVRAASDWCREIARAHGERTTLAVVTHGVMRRLLLRELATTGWKPQGWRRSYSPWSVWTVGQGDDVPRRPNRSAAP
jgi:broad specificity phosphatase PhoE